MKKNLLISLLLINILFLNTMALNDIDESKLDKILMNKTLLELENLSKESLTLKDFESIYDINGMENIVLLTFKEGGYTFVNKEDGQIIMYVPSTYDIPFTNVSSNSKKIFGGPYTYLIKNDKNEIIHLETNNIVDKNEIDFNINSKVNKNNAERLLDNYQSLIITPQAYTGLTESRFSNYNSTSWRNYDGTCGTYATSILIAYLDDYVNDKYIPSSIRTRSSTIPGSLITTLKPLIDGRTNYTGTVPYDLYMGSTQFFSNYGISVVHDYGLTTFSTAKTVINSGRPIAIGLLTILGSPYNDHWVTAYQYEDGTLLNDYYKVVDNHGNYKAIISVGWTSGFYKITG